MRKVTKNHITKRRSVRAADVGTCPQDCLLPASILKRYYSAIVTILALYFFIQYQLCSVERVDSGDDSGDEDAGWYSDRSRASIERDKAVIVRRGKTQPCSPKAPKPDDPVFCKWADEIMETDPPTYLPDLRSPCFRHNVVKHVPDKTNITKNRTEVVSHLLCLPSVYIVGVSKCGTTDVFSHLLQHQHVIAPYDKEPHFWDNVRTYILRNTWKHYLDNYSQLSSVTQFCFLQPDRDKCSKTRYLPSQQKAWQIKLNMSRLSSDLQFLRKIAQPSPLISVDATSTYLNTALAWQQDAVHRNMTNIREPQVIAPHRIKYFVPDAKIIIFLRDPIERLISDFYFFIEGKLKRSAKYLHHVVVNGVKWWKRCLQKNSEYRCAYGDDYSDSGLPNLGSGLFSWGDSDEVGHNAAGRLRIGMYVIYIETWLQIFPPEQIYIQAVEHYNLTVLEKEILPFLQLEPMPNTTYTRLRAQQKMGHKNQAKAHKKGQVLPETRAILQELYRPYNMRLAKLLNDKKYKFDGS